MADHPLHFMAQHKLEAINRELGFRRTVYARRVAEKRMSQKQSDEQIAVFEAIRDDYERIAPRAATMKALTVWQPWASLIHIGAKPFEFRGWRAPSSAIGQRIVNHAGARPVKMNEVLDLIRHLESGDRDIVTSTCLLPEMALPFLRGLRDRTASAPTSVALGSFTLGEPRNGIEIAEEFDLARVNDSERDFAANWGWPVLDYEAWPEPIPMRGAQGLWRWPEPQDVLA